MDDIKEMEEKALKTLERKFNEAGVHGW